MDSQRYDTSYDSLEKRIDVGKQQLLSIFKFFQINPADTIGLIFGRDLEYGA